MIKISKNVYYINNNGNIIKMHRQKYGDNDVPSPPLLVLEPSLKDFSKINKQYKYTTKKFIVKNIQKNLSNTI